MAIFSLANITSDFTLTPPIETSHEQKTLKRFLKDFADLPHAYYREQAREIATADITKSVKYQVRWIDAVGRQFVVPAKLLESGVDPQVTSQLSKLPSEILSAILTVLNSQVRKEAQLKTPYPDMFQYASSNSTGAAALALTCKKLCALSLKSRVMVYEGFVRMMSWYKPRTGSAFCHGCCNLVSTDFDQWLVDTQHQELGNVPSWERRYKQHLVEWLVGPAPVSALMVWSRASNESVGKMVQEWCEQSWAFCDQPLFDHPVKDWCPMCLAQVMHQKWIAGGLFSHDNSYKQLDSRVTKWMKDHKDQISSDMFDIPQTKDSLYMMTTGWRMETQLMRPGPRSWPAHSVTADGVN